MIATTSSNRLTILLTLGIVVMGSNSFILSPILTDVAKDMGTTPIVIARVISTFGAATAFSSFLFGGMVDRIGARAVLLSGAGVMTVALIGSALSTSWQMLAFSQATIGCMVGVMLPAIYASATSNAPEGEGAKVLGKVISGWGIALVLGVPFSAFLSDLYSWRLPFGVLAAFAAVVMIGFAALPHHQPNIADPNRISPVKALGIPDVLPILFLCLVFMTAFYGAYAFLGDHIRTTINISASYASLVVLSYGAGFGGASIADSRIDRIGPQRVLPAMLLVIAAIYLVLIPATNAFFTSLIAAFCWGFANHISINIIILLLSSKRPSARGALMGLHTATTYMSVFLGPLLFGFLYTGGSFAIMCFVASGLLVLGAIVAWKI